MKPQQDTNPTKFIQSWHTACNTYSKMKVIQIIKKYPWHFAGLLWILLIVVFILLYSLLEHKEAETTHHHHSEINQSWNHENTK